MAKLNPNFPGHFRSPLIYFEYRLLLYFACACHIKYKDILGGTPTWDLDVPVHPIVTNHAGWPSAPGT